jgi:TonB family protein
MEPRAPRLSTPEEPYDPQAPTISLGGAPATIARTAPPFVALSEDPMLLEAMTSAAMDQASVIVSPSADRFVDQLVATSAELALIDAAAAPQDLAEFLTSLHRQFPQLLLLLAGPGNVQHQIATQLTDGTVFRFAHKPASAQRLKLFVDAAVRQRQSRITEQILSMPFDGRPGAAAASKSSSGRPWWMTASLIAALLGAAGGALVWYFSSSGHAPTAPTASSLPAQAQAPPPQRQTPAPSAVIPQNTGAAAAARQKELEQDAIDHAAAQRAETDRIAAENESRVATTAEQIRHAAADAAKARAEQVHEFVQLAQSRIASGALIEPADECARTYVSSAQELSPDDEGVRAVSIALGEALIGSFRKAMAVGDSTSAEHWLKASRGYQVSEATLEQMAVQLRGFQASQSAQEAATQAMATIETEMAAETSAPAASIVAVTAPATSQVIEESELHRLNFVAPKYPAEALSRGQTGTVELEFTVTPKGTVSDVKVTAADPVGVFEHASIDALLSARYEPIELDGVAVSQRAHISMRFAL